eukprot:maker-scaffold_7-snap-gene-12.38-mRNA-1 protein AED:0.02 eAED:0.02 QI:59/1/1/1/0/0/3/109/440
MKKSLFKKFSIANKVGYDYVIGGGGIMGASTAFFLKKIAPQASVCVIERDQTYAVASTPLSVGGFRQQFSVKENIEMSLYSNHFLLNLADELGLPKEETDVQYFQEGYLILSTTKEGSDILTENTSLQRSYGCEVVLESNAELSKRFPWMSFDDILLGAVGLKNEGWLDPYSLLQLFRKAGKKLGVEYISTEITGFSTEQNLVRAVNTKDSSDSSNENVVHCEVFINCCGSWSNHVNSLFSTRDLQVAPRKRDVFVVQVTKEDAEFINSSKYNSVPLVSDPSGIWFRRDGPKGSRTFLVGNSPCDNYAEEDPDVNCSLKISELDEIRSQSGDLNEKWEEFCWPSVAHRAPLFEKCKVINTWSGFYDYNKLDQNAIVGKHIDFSNVYLATGFSGHGLQQGPAIGKALSELVRHGEYKTIDLRRLSMERLINNEPLRERNII